MQRILVFMKNTTQKDWIQGDNIISYRIADTLILFKL